MSGSRVRAGGRGLVCRPENKESMEEEEEEEESLNTGIVAVSVCDILLSSQSANFQNPSNTARLRGLGLPLQG